jgi:hypothetical protein
MSIQKGGPRVYAKKKAEPKGLREGRSKEEEEEEGRGYKEGEAVGLWGLRASSKLSKIYTIKGTLDLGLGCKKRLVFRSRN